LAQVLVVDDNAVMRTVMRVALERAGHTVTMAEDGVKALQATGSGQFDLVITDIQMPKMDGVDLVQALKKTAPQVKVLVISGRLEGTELQDMTSKKTLGASGSLEKPFTADRLVSKVAEVLG
jgi:two-component system chemotaxis response regulator CheY